MSEYSLEPAAPVVAPKPAKVSKAADKPEVTVPDTAGSYVTSSGSVYTPA